MSYTGRRESRPSADSSRTLNDYVVDTSGDLNNRDSLPKYYPRDHEVTKWLVNQMRCRNGLHHLVNLANVQPTLLSAYFELYDQPSLYIDARTGPGMPAYGLKTVLYLTPLAIAIYFRLKSVLRLLLDTSGTRIHARTRQEVDVNATCYVRRSKPRPGPFVMDEYSTTLPAILAVRREFFAGLGILMAAGYNPQEPIGIIERLGTPREKTYWFADLLDFGVKLLNTRPGVDVNGLLQTITYRMITADNPASAACYYDPCVYDIKQMINEPGKNLANTEMWFSIFQRLVRKGASRTYSNCGNRLIGLLEYVATAGFFRQRHMPKGIVEYDRDIFSRKFSRTMNVKKVTPEMIARLTDSEKEMARINIAVDRDICLCLLTIWLERVRNRCLDRQAQRLYRLLTVALADTGLLRDFLYPPNDIDTSKTIYPYWVSLGIGIFGGRQQSVSSNLVPLDFLDEEANDMCELEPPQLNEIRQEIGILGHTLGLVDYSDKLYNLGYPRLVEIMPAIRGDTETPFNEHNRTKNNADTFSNSQIESADQFVAYFDDFDKKCPQNGKTNIPGSSSATNLMNKIKNTNNNLRTTWLNVNRVGSKSPTTDARKTESQDLTKVISHAVESSDQVENANQNQSGQKKHDEKTNQTEKPKENLQNSNVQSCSSSRKPNRSSRVLVRKDDTKSRAMSESALNSSKSNGWRSRTVERRKY